MKKSKFKLRQLMVSLLCMLLVFTMIPTVSPYAYGAVDTRVTDPSTMNGWQQYFGSNVKNTSNAGHIWTDKSVFKDANSLSPVNMTDAEKNFMVALSAISSNKEIKGYSYIPTDTMLVLDVSGSMRTILDKDGNSIGTTEERVDAMIKATNAAITELLELNRNNRVGLILFSGNTSYGASGTDTATVILPLGRYTADETTTIDGEKVGVFIERSGTTVRLNQNNYGRVQVRNTEGNRMPSKGKNVAGGTYTQNGIYQAWEEFEAVDDVAIEEGFQVGHKRMPIMVLMTDGAPTSATTSYTNVGTSNMGHGGGQCATAPMGFVNQLTAAWTRLMMADKYKNEPKFYTLGLGLDNVKTGRDVAESVLNPSLSTTAINNLWNSYENSDRVTFTAYSTSTESNGNTSFTINANDVIKNAISKANDSDGTIKHPQQYVDEAFTADDADGLIEAFDAIVEQIILQSKYYPTDPEGNTPNMSGYIEFKDDIGEFMEVKDMKGILIGDTLYSGAEVASKLTVSGSKISFKDGSKDYTEVFLKSVMERLGISSEKDAEDLVLAAYHAGQLSYNSSSDYSNFIGWFSDADGNYLGFSNPESKSQAVPSGAKYANISYGFFGTPGDKSIEASNMMYMSVRIQTEIATGRQTVLWQVPAALIPTITYNVSMEGTSYDTASNIKMTMQDAEPVRLVYEVGLRDDINEFTVANKLADEEHVHKDADGNFEFYTNRWGDGDLDGKIDIDYSNPKVHDVAQVNYCPSQENETYYFADDAVVYVKSGNEYVPAKSNPATTSGTYYYAYPVFTQTSGDNATLSYEYRQISKLSLGSAIKDDKGTSTTSDDTYFIPAGTIYKTADDYRTNKTSNPTGTMEYAYYPVITSPSGLDNYHEDAFLGNNGKMTLTPATGIELSKTIDVVAPGTETDFDFVIRLTPPQGGSLSASYPAARFDSDGNQIGDRFNLDVNNGVINVNVSHGESVIIADMAPGTGYHIDEVISGDSDYVVKSVNGSTSKKFGEGTVVDKELAKVDFVNTLKKHNNLLISKVVDHPFGPNYVVPDSIEFDVVVELNAPSGDILDDGYSVVIGDKTTNCNVNDGKITFTIKDGETATIRELPEGTTYVVKEVNLSKGFELDLNKSTDREGTITSDEVSSETLVNKYTPTTVEEVDVNLNGKKTLTGRTWAEGDAFTFALQKFNGTKWETIHTETVTKDNKTFDFSDVLQNEIYATAGDYHYRVYELGSDNNGITYDKTERYFDIVVTDVDMDGKLEIQPPTNLSNPDTYFVKGIGSTDVDFRGTEYYITTDFENKYAPETSSYTDIEILKKIVNNTGIDIPLSGFEFELYYARDYDTEEERENAEYIVKTEETSSEGKAYIRLVYEVDDFVKEDGKETSVERDENGNIIKKVYNYTLVESKGNTPGMIYDPAMHDIMVIVTDNFDGTLSAEIAVNGVITAAMNVGKASFTNTYDLGKATADLSVSKTLSGRDMKDKEFAFALYEANEQFAIVGGALQTIKVPAANDSEAVSKAFESLEFTSIGTYRYIVSEVIPDVNGDKGITYDTSAYHVTVNVTATDDGKLKAETQITKEGAAVTEMTFSNTYTVSDTTLNLRAKKNLNAAEGTSRPLKADEFTFQLYHTDSSYSIEGLEPIQTKTNTAAGAVPFDPIAYTQKDHMDTTQYYVIKEVAGDKGGVTYDKSLVKVKVEIYAEDGELKTRVFVDGEENGDIVFTNRYAATPTKVDLGGNKVLSGRDFADGEKFSFQLLSESGRVLQTVTNEAPVAPNMTSAAFNFETLTFDEVGEYKYTIKEVIPDEADRKGGITYDNTKYTVVVKVTDNGNGALQASYTIDGQKNKPVVFTNTYKTESAQTVIVATKILEGRNLEANEFTFDLIDSSNKIVDTKKNTDAVSGNVVFNALKFDKVTPDGKPHVYTVRERIEGKSGIIYDDTLYTVEITVSDDGSGRLVATQAIKKESGNIMANTEAITFTNYDPQNAEVDLDFVKKTLDGRDMEAGEFSFKLELKSKPEDVESKNSWNQTVTNVAAADGVQTTVPFDKLVFDTEGTYVFEITETAGDKGGVTYSDEKYQVTVNVVNNNNVLVATKVITKLAGGIGENLLTAQFTNEYNTTPVTEDIIIGVTKALTGRDFEAGEFKFELKDVTSRDAADHKVIQTKTNGAPVDGVAEIDFDAIEYKEAGVYKYQISEVKETSGGVTYDETVYTVTVEVVDNLDGTLTVGDAVYTVNGKAKEPAFENTYKPDEAEVEITASKNMTGRDLEGRDFTFKLIPDANNPVKQDEVTVSNGNVSGGSAADITFGKLTFTEAGTYKYTVKEVIPQDAEDNQKDGVTYDATEYEVVIEVTDNYEGQLEAEVKVDGSANKQISFNNAYNTTPAKITLNAKKVLEGDSDLEEGQFQFGLYEEGNSSAIQTKTNDANGNIAFDELEFAEEGQFVYTIQEIPGSDKTINYDTNEYTVVIDVEDNGKGQMVAKVNGEAYDGGVVATITNHDPKNTDLEVDFVKKVLNGRDMEKGAFTFKLSVKEKPEGVDAKEEWNQTVTNAAAEDGKQAAVTFEKLPFDVAGTYVFEVTEEAGDLGGVTYSTEKHQVTVKVVNIDNVLEVSSVVIDEQSDAEEIEFVNTYKPEPETADVIIGVTKALTGRDFEAGEFKFELKDVTSKDAADHKVIQTKTNGAPVDGVAEIDFDAIEYKEAGVYKYQISEVKETLGGVTYDETVYTVTVEVVDNLDGTLTVGDAVYTVNGLAKDPAFKNTYKPEKTEVEITANKNMTGRDLEGRDFTFKLIPDANNPVKQDEVTVSNGNVSGGSAADITFGKLTFTEAGTYKYTVKEVIPQDAEDNQKDGVTYDATEYEVVIEVTDNYEGQLEAEVKVDGSANKQISFNNAYNTTPAKVSLNAKKVLEGDSDLEEGQFEFGLYEEGKSSAIQTKTNDANGNIAFDELEFAEEGQFIYTIQEIAGSDKTIDYDTNEYTVVIDVEDNGKGQMVAKVNGEAYDGGVVATITNHNPENTDLEVDFVKKVLNGRDMKAGEFTFKLSVKEKPEGVDAKEEWNQIGSNVATNDGAQARVEFEKLPFDVAGTYVFEVTEEAGDLGGVTYSTEKHQVTVTVVNIDNVLEVSSVVFDDQEDAEEIEFVNTYKPEPKTADVILGVKKTLTGRDFAEGEFKFELKTESDAPDLGEKILQTKTNAVVIDGTAEVDFDAITFEEAGTYKFWISEVNDGRGGVTYDETVYEVTVEVVDNLDGTLTVKDAVYTVEGQKTEPVFENSYTAEKISFTIEGEKTLRGMKLSDGMFKFNLYAASLEDGQWTRGKLLETVKNDENGNITFTTQTYEAEGEYYFMVAEDTSKAMEGITFDKNVYLVKVTVVDDNEGQLVVSQQIQKQANNRMTDEIVFSNSYRKPLPKTGDSNNLGLWTAMLALCASGFAGLTILKNKEEEEEA